MAIIRTENAAYPDRCHRHGMYGTDGECYRNEEMALECLRYEEAAVIVAQERSVWTDSDGGDHETITNILETYAGRVVETYIKYGVQVMSDVWEDQRWATVMLLNGTFMDVYAGYYRDGFVTEADALPEMVEAWKAEQARRKVEAEETERRIREARAAEERKIPRKGRRVRVVRGRKVAIGTEGDCFWEGNTGYGWRLGLRMNGGDVVWVAAKNCEAIDGSAVA